MAKVPTSSQRRPPISSSPGEIINTRRLMRTFFSGPEIEQRLNVATNEKLCNWDFAQRGNRIKLFADILN